MKISLGRVMTRISIHFDCESDQEAQTVLDHLVSSALDNGTITIKTTGIRSEISFPGEPKPK